METNERVYVHAREIGGACLTEVESVGRLRVSSRGHRSAFLRIVALAREERTSLYRRVVFRADHHKLRVSLSSKNGDCKWQFVSLVSRNRASSHCFLFRFLFIFQFACAHLEWKC